MIFRCTAWHLVLVAAATTASGPAVAEWVKVGETRRVATFYVHDGTIRRDGDLRVVSTIQNLAKRTAEGVLSLKSVQEFDCRQRRWRVVFATSHPGPMAKGKILALNPEPGQWMDVPPDSPSETVYGLVCTEDLASARGEGEKPAPAKPAPLPRR